MIALRQETGGNYSRMMAVSTLDAETLDRARSIFDDYKARGVMQGGSFDDDVWQINDEKSTTAITLFDPAHTLPSWIGCSDKEYTSCLKTYIAFNLGELSPYTLQDIVREITRFSEINTAGSKYPNHLAAFLQLLPGGSFQRDRMIENLSEYEPRTWSSSKNRQRVLADFQSYLRFGDALAEFWRNANTKQHLFYFPLYFWWNLTAILPLRVTEFLLTPQNSFEELGGKYFLTVRRSRLKGGDKKISYKIAEDYTLHKYEISSLLGAEIRAYITATKNLPKNRLDTLILTSSGKRDFYSYVDLVGCMRAFYDEVILPSGTPISTIKLGDTRHLAMISLVISGGSPTVCRELAGHSDINISSHYYTNISNLIQCATLERLRKNKAVSETSITGKAKYSLAKPNYAQQVNGGYCESESFAHHDISECSMAVGVDGQIGDCNACSHFYPDKQGIQVNIAGRNSAAKAKVDEDSVYLCQTIELVRRGLGYSEDIRAALLRLQHSSNRYSAIIREKYDYGKT